VNKALLEAAAWAKTLKPTGQQLEPELELELELDLDPDLVKTCWKQQAPAYA